MTARTATRLRDGRVLIAGGASRALLSFVPLSSGAAWDVRIEPMDELSTPTALASFEMFDPEALPETEDILRDGDEDVRGEPHELRVRAV